jgi:soluble lytic murein transglycosylase-like protein
MAISICVEKKTMKKLRLFVCAALLAIGCVAGSTPGHAQASYEDVRAQSVIVPFQSMKQLRENVRELDGNSIEMDGAITGIMTRDDGRMALLKVGDEMAVLSAPLELQSQNLLRTGTFVRVLALLKNDGRGGKLTILALKEGAAPIANAPHTDDAVQILVAQSDNGLLSAPMTSSITPLPQAPGASVATSPRAPAKPQTLRPNQLGVGEREELIESQIPFYTAIIRQHNKKLKPEVVQEIAVAILRAGYQYDLDPRFIAAIIAVESDFDVYCLSGSGAMGLGQLMPFNLKEAGITNAWNPTQNVMGTAKLLRGHLNDYKGRKDATLLAVAAYNAGPGAVRRAGYKVPNGKQVQRYVWKVYYRYKAFAPDMF